MSDPNTPIQCNIHGESHVTYVCQHLVNGHSGGFYFGNTSDPRPDAWCYECDCRLLKDGEWNDENEAFAKVTVLCAGCYDNVRARNSVIRPTLDIDGWVVGSQNDVHETTPSFRFPLANQVNDLPRGSLVKLLFLIVDSASGGKFLQGERMWVRVLHQMADGYVGMLESEPMTKGNLMVGQIITFANEQILDTHNVVTRE